MIRPSVAQCLGLVGATLAAGLTAGEAAPTMERFGDATPLEWSRRMAVTQHSVLSVG